MSEIALDYFLKPSNTKIANSLLETIGSTPLVRINRIAKHLPCEIVAKVEFFNPGGSIKDRISQRMIIEKIRDGQITKETTVIEASSGNTAIGVALIGAILGIKVIITIPKKMSNEKVSIIRALGAKVIRTSDSVHSLTPESNLGVAKQLVSTIPASVYLNQYSNKHNPKTHYETTAEEIIDQCDGKIDMIVIGAGTGGSITGIARKFREKLPKCKIIGVDPKGSLLANDDDPVYPYQIEGIGYDFVPDVLDRTLADEWFKSDDGDSFKMSRRIIREEGILVGGSSGAAMCAALSAAKTLKKGQRCVVIFPDSSKNYITKFIDDKWMWEKGYISGEKIPQNIKYPPSKIIENAMKNTTTIPFDASCKSILETLDENTPKNFSVVSKTGVIDKIVSIDDIKNNSEGKVKDIAKNCPRYLIDGEENFEMLLNESKSLLIFNEQKIFANGRFKSKESFVGIYEN